MLDTAEVRPLLFEVCVDVERSVVDEVLVPVVVEEIVEAVEVLVPVAVEEILEAVEVLMPVVVE